MKQLPGTNIFVNFNLFTDAEREASAVRARAAFQRDLARNPALRQVIDEERALALEKYGGYSEWRTDVAVDQAVDRDGLLDEVAWAKRTKEGDEYEKEVLALLAEIRRDATGRLLMDKMSSQWRIWVVPLTEKRQNDCGCVGVTSGRMSVNNGGGVRLYFTPIPGQTEDGYFSNQDILFHELVHAYRSSVLDNKQHWMSPLRDYKTEEEVLAVHVTNVYRAGRGYNTYYRSHRISTLLNKHMIDRYLAHDREVFFTMQAFLKEDKLAKAIARLNAPRFNPWRDFAELQRIRDTEIDL